MRRGLAFGIWLLAAGCTQGPSSTPDASNPDASVAHLVVAPVDSTIRIRSEAFGVVEGGLQTLRGRALVMSGSLDPGCFLWGTDGTAPGTQVLAQLSRSNGRCTQNTSALYYHPVVVRGEAYVLWGESEFNPTDLWRTDGTASGTRKIAVPPRPGQLFALNDSLLLVNEDPPGTWTLSQYRPEQDVFETLASLGPQFSPPLFRGSGRLGTRGFFSLVIGRTSIWETDGTAAGTHEISGMPDIQGQAIEQRGRMVFVGALDTTSGVWASDGTAAGSRLIAENLRDGGLVSFASNLAALNDQVLFTQQRITNPVPLPYQLMSIAPEQNTPTPIGAPVSRYFDRWLLPRAGELLFVGRGDAGEFSVNAVGANPGSERALTPLTSPGVELLSANNPVQAGGRIVFQGSSPDLGLRGPGVSVWSTDGTPSGTEILLQSHSTAPHAVVDGGLVLFDGNNLWSSNATAAGTKLFANLWRDPPPGLVSLGNAAFFVDKSGLWRSPGIDAGATLLSPPLTVRHPIFVGGGRLALIDFAQGAPALWVSDGTSAGTRRFPIPSSFQPERIVQLDELRAVLAGTDQPLLRVDFASGVFSTLPGTESFFFVVPVADHKLIAIEPGSTIGTLKQLDPATGALTGIPGAPPVNPYSLLVSDGTSAWFSGEYSKDGGLTGIWTIDPTGVHALGGIPGPSYAKPLNGTLVALGYSGSTGVLWSLGKTSAPREIARLKGFSSAEPIAVGGLIAFGFDGLTLFDPEAGRTWHPNSALTRVALPTSAQSDAGFLFGAAQGDGGVSLFYYDRATDTVAPAPVAVSHPQGFVEVAGQTIFWGDDPLGWALWAGSTSPLH